MRLLARVNLFRVTEAIRRAPALSLPEQQSASFCGVHLLHRVAGGFLAGLRSRGGPDEPG